MNEDAKILAKRAAAQAEHATKNGAEAAEVVAEDLANKAEERLGLSSASKGFLSLLASAVFVTLAFTKFKQALEEADALEAEDRPEETPTTEGD